MKNYKILYRIVVGISGTILITVGWAVVCYAGIAIYQMDYVFDLSPMYEMWHWPGVIMRYEKEPDGSYTPQPAPEFLQGDTADTVTRIAEVKNDYVVGTADRGLFVFDRRSGQLWYPLKNSSDIKPAVGIQFEESRLSDRFPWSLVRWRTGVWKIPVLIGFLCGTSVTSFLVWWWSLCRRNPQSMIK
jgi:hypothetical protein